MADDDPTRALDDFVRRMRPSAPREDTPDLSDLTRAIAPEAAPAGGRARGGRLRSGERWSSDDVVDVPAVERRSAPRTDTVPPEVVLPPIEQPRAPDTETIDAALTDAARAAADAYAADARVAQLPWQPDIDALMQRRARNPRLLAAWQPGCWIGAMREVFDAATEFVTTAARPVVETYPAHRLLLAWVPQPMQQPMLGRWPAQVRLSAVPAEAAAEVLLAQLPDEALLWLDGDPAAIDWGLAAEIVLHHDPTLRPFQIERLRAFVDAEREAVFARLNADYTAAAGVVARR